MAKSKYRNDMNRSKLINHVNHLEIEISMLQSIAEDKASKREMSAILIYDTTIAVLKSRLEQCKEELKTE